MATDPPPLLYGSHLNTSSTEIGAGFLSKDPHGADEKGEKDVTSMPVEDARSVENEQSFGASDDGDHALLGVDDPFVSKLSVEPSSVRCCV